MHTVERVISCTTAIFICRIDNWCKQAQFFVAFLLASFVADWLRLCLRALMGSVS